MKYMLIMNSPRDGYTQLRLAGIDSLRTAFLGAPLPLTLRRTQELRPTELRPV